MYVCMTCFRFLGNVVHMQHFDLTPVDHMPLNDLLLEVGADTVSFPKDKRVITL